MATPISAEISYNDQLDAYMHLHPRGPFTAPAFQSASGNVLCGHGAPTEAPESDCAVYYNLDSPFETFKWNSETAAWE